MGGLPVSRTALGVEYRAHLQGCASCRPVLLRWLGQILAGRVGEEADTSGMCAEGLRLRELVHAERDAGVTD